MEKLIIKKAMSSTGSSNAIRVSTKTRKMIDEIAKKTGKSKVWVAEALVQFAYDRVVVETDNNTADDSTE